MRSALIVAWLVVGCGGTHSDSVQQGQVDGGGASTTTPTSTSCSLASVPGIDFCKAASAYGEQYVDDTGVPAIYSVILKGEEPNLCASLAGDMPDMRFVKVQLYGPLLGDTCKVQAFPSRPRAASCEAVVSVEQTRGTEKLILHARSGEVKITHAGGGKLTAHVAAAFPAEGYFTGPCEGNQTDHNAPLGHGTCRCEDAAGKTKTCATETLEVACCNGTAAPDQSVEFDLDTAACTTLCACTTDVMNCPCATPAGQDPPPSDRP